MVCFQDTYKTNQDLEMELEGILIHKAVHKERDLIGTLLLREGTLVNFYFYGGRGGGKSQKGSILELGFMLKVKLTSRIKKNQDIHIAKEWSLVWNSNSIRGNHNAFYLTSFYFEFIRKVATPKDLEYYGEENSGLFKVLSNSLVLIDKSLDEGHFHLETCLLGFLSKMTFELGILPDLDHCLFCSDDLLRDRFIFDVKNGGFVCSQCSDQMHPEELKAAGLVQEVFAYSKKTKFSDFQMNEEFRIAQVHSLFNYICFHFGWDKNKFISLNLIL